jgi:hypothetical protein
LSCIEPGSPWENGYAESINARMRAAFLNGELFNTTLEAQVLTQRWIRYHNQARPHSNLGGRPRAPQTAAQLPHRTIHLLTLLLNHKTGQSSGILQRKELVHVWRSSPKLLLSDSIRGLFDIKSNDLSRV